VVLCIFCAAPLIVSDALHQELLSVIMTGVLLAICAAGVFCFVLGGIRYDAYESLLKGDRRLRAKREMAKKKGKTAFGLFSEVYWLIITVTYFAWSFISGDWHVSWLTWLAGSAIFTVIKLIYKVKTGKDAEPAEDEDD
jgi:hypothetical protein